jgi:general secretion pathway protein F
MPVYEYNAISPAGKKLKGAIESDTIRTARQKLRGQGLFPTDIRELAVTSVSKSKDIRRHFVSNRVSLRDLSIATRQLATLVAAGLPLVTALNALADQTEAESLKRIIIDVKEKVEEGLALNKALLNFPKAFPKLYINMVASGEASGTLDTVLENLADYLESQLELRRKVTSALTYPILMLAFCVLVVVALVTFVVPKIVQIFIKQGTTLPLPTRILIAISDALVNYWYVGILLFVIIILGLRLYYKQPSGRSFFDKLIMKLPIIGGIYKKVVTARVARTLGALLNSGVNLLAALDIVRNMSSNVHVAKALDEAKDGVREGRSLAKELSKSKIFPNMLCHMIAVGESSGKLEDMLDKAGHSYERDVNAVLSGLTSLIEPIMIIALGGIVFCIVIAILLPMVDLINVVQAK